MTGWKPWRELRSREHIRLEWARMFPAKGCIRDEPGGIRVITLDPRLSQVQRRATLSHELVHDEYDLLWPAGTPLALVQKGERFVECESCDRLIYPEYLRKFVENYSEIEAVTSRVVAEEFFVPLDVALLALERLDAVF